MSMIRRVIDLNENEAIEVEFYGESTKTIDDYNDEYGTIKGMHYYFIENIDWDAYLYSKEVNEIINSYVNEHFSSIEEKLIEIYGE